eukprot:761167-Hanusia_phi.AAC.2
MGDLDSAVEPGQLRTVQELGSRGLIMTEYGTTPTRTARMGSEAQQRFVNISARPASDSSPGLDSARRN